MNTRFQQAIALMDAENSRDPRQEALGEKSVPQELLYSQRLTDWVLKLNPQASECLLLAARSQHICRWNLPRSNFSPNKAGYHQWKNELRQFHARLTGEILRKVGYDEETIARVRALNLKAEFPADPESRTLEDALCLVFLQYQFADLANRAEPAKVINALRKSWAKMTQQGRNEALNLNYSATEKHLLELALGANQVDS